MITMSSSIVFSLRKRNKAASFHIKHQFNFSGQFGRTKYVLILKSDKPSENVSKFSTAFASIVSSILFDEVISV